MKANTKFACPHDLTAVFVVLGADHVIIRPVVAKNDEKQLPGRIGNLRSKH